jgi:hypothetical protein
LPQQDAAAEQQHGQGQSQDGGADTGGHHRDAAHHDENETEHG